MFINICMKLLKKGKFYEEVNFVFFIKKIVAYYKANNFPLVVMNNYFKFSSKSELIFDIVIPFIISIIFVFVMFTDKYDTFEEIVDTFYKVNGNVITAISILAGFNFASISLLASSNSETITKLKEELSEEHSTEVLKVTHFDLVLSFFSWAIIVQITTIAFILIVMSFFSLNLNISVTYILLVKIIGVIWCTLVIHSLLITIRNVKNMYFFMKYEEK